MDPQDEVKVEAVPQEASKPAAVNGSLKADVAVAEPEMAPILSTSSHGAQPGSVSVNPNINSDSCSDESQICVEYFT